METSRGGGVGRPRIRRVWWVVAVVITSLALLSLLQLRVVVPLQGGDMRDPSHFVRSQVTGIPRLDHSGQEVDGSSDAAGLQAPRRPHACYTSLEKLLQAVSPGKETVYWTVVEKDPLNAALNVLVSWDRVGIEHVFAVAMDVQTAEWLERMEVLCFIQQCVLDDDTLTMQKNGTESSGGSAPPGERAPSQAWAQPQVLVTLEIARLGYNQMFQSQDTVPLRKPLLWVEKNPQSEHVDYWVQDEGGKTGHEYYWIRSTPSTIRFLEKVLDGLSADPRLTLMAAQRQEMDRLSRERTPLRFQLFPTTLFPSSRDFFEDMVPQRHRRIPYLVHNARVRGPLSRVYLLQQQGVWFVENKEYYRRERRGFISVTGMHPPMPGPEHDMEMRNLIILGYRSGRIPILPHQACGDQSPHSHCDMSMVHRSPPYDLEALLEFLVRYEVEYRPPAFRYHQTFLQGPGRFTVRSHVWVGGETPKDRAIIGPPNPQCGMSWENMRQLMDMAEKWYLVEFDTLVHRIAAPPPEHANFLRELNALLGTPAIPECKVK